MKKITSVECPTCNEPMIFTFVFPYKEYACLPCDTHDEFFPYGNKKEYPEKKIEELKKLWRNDLDVIAFRNGAGCGKCNKKINEGECKKCEHGKKNARNKDYKFKYWKANL